MRSASRIRLDGERLHAQCEPLRGRHPYAVEREDDAHDSHRAVQHPFDEGEPLAGPGQREEPFRRKTAPGQGRVFDLRRRDFVRIDTQTLLPLREQPAGPERYAVEDRVRARRHPPRKQPRHLALGELARPPDELHRHALAQAGDPARRRVLLSPGAEVRQPCGARVLEAGLEWEHLRCDDEHLDVRDVVGHAARDAPGHDHLLSDVGRKGIRNALGELAQLLAPVCFHRHPATILAVKRYHVTTFGCQMNAHDSERIKGLLEELGLGETSEPENADVLVFNTCTIREKPDTRLAAHLGNARVLKQRDPQRVIAVGGCYAEAQRERIFEQYPFVDVAFGPGSISHLGDWIGAGGVGVARGRFGTGDERSFAAELPSHRERPVQAWVQISMGCNSVCSYCIVPAVRGREVSRPAVEVLAEIECLAEQGVREVTLLGQNVNSYGRDVGSDFAELLRAVDAVDGIERIRFTSPHPKDFRANVIAAMAECDAVCEHAHLPLQSGSTRVLKAMRRTYGRERYLRLVEEMRAAIPDLALTTDIIVGFPGETEEDFRETLEVVEEVRYDGAFTFVYSPRAGTEAAAMEGKVPDEIKRDRIERLVEVVQRIARERNEDRVGLVEQVLVEGASRTDPALLRGRTRRNTTVNFAGSAEAGNLVDVRIDGATSTTLRGSELAAVAA